MATLLALSAEHFKAAPDGLLVAGDVQASPEENSVGRSWWAFDDTDEEAIVSGNLVMPTTYTGSGLKVVLFGFFKTEATATDEAIIEIASEAVTPDTDTLDLETAKSFDSVNSQEVDPPGTAGDLTDWAVTMTNADSVAPGDIFRIAIRRNCGGAADTATGDFCIVAAEIEDDG